MIAAEFSRVCATDRLPLEGQAFAIEANRSERMMIARRLDLVALDSLRARGTITRRGADQVIEVKGSLTADVVQRCVVTLEPVPAALRSDFVRLFSTEAAGPPAEIEIDPAAELIEPLDAELIDLGEIAAEELSLALDPYPRAVEGLPADLADAAEREAGDGPFSALASLRRH